MPAYDTGRRPRATPDGLRYWDPAVPVDMSAMLEIWTVFVFAFAIPAIVPTTLWEMWRASRADAATWSHAWGIHHSGTQER